MKSLPTILALTLLQACATGHSSPSRSCGTLFVYDKQTELVAAREYDSMRTASTFPVTREMMDDYHTTRDTIRECGK